ncbi:MAG TPA: hypothetical protein VE309_13900 [Caulobacteraceae bacterium]|nr:hypothetical protein [Caulobacteraceae bacterium]
MKKFILAALAASTLAGAIAVSATPAQARPWGYWHRPYYGYGYGYRPYYGYGYGPYAYGPYGYGPGFYAGVYPYWGGYYGRYRHFRR